MMSWFNNHQFVVVLCLLIFVCLERVNPSSADNEDDGVMYPTSCEVCKYVAVELQDRLKETGKTREILRIGSGLDDTKKTRAIPYQKSELRLVESLEGICERILEYNIHKERKDSTRFAKGMSQTFQTLHGLKDKGVKVELGIPYELWDKPSVEVTSMKSQCEQLLEQYDEDIEEWYNKHQEIPLQTFLCSQRVLRKGDDGCLIEAVTSASTADTKVKKKAKKKSKEKKIKQSGSQEKDEL